MRKFIALVLCLAMVFSIVGCSNTPTSSKPVETGIFKPGSYEGEADGLNGKIKVLVTVDTNNILSIEVKEHKETPTISDPAFSKMPNEIIKYQTVALDTISGCTYSSKGVLEAVKAALLAAGAKEADITKVPVKSEASGETIKKTVDVVVIGSGGAGMSAAYEAAKVGGTVIVIEKNPSVGGNTALAGSAMNAADPERQQKLTMGASEMKVISRFIELGSKNEIMAEWQKELSADIEEYKKSGSTYLYDSPSLHKLQTYVDGDYVGNPILIDILGDNALGSLEFLSSLGTIWKDGITSAVGATWTRSHTPTKDWGSAGSAFVLPQEKAFRDLGGEVYLEHKAEELITDNGRVIGVKGTTADGTSFEFIANKGVVIATGGFGANVEMRQKYNKYWASLDENVRTTNGPFATGDGIVMAEAIGANLIGMEWIQLVPTATAFIPTINNTIFITAQGERFINEDARRDELSGAILKLPEKYCYSIVDAHTTVDELNGIAYNGKVIEEMVNGKTIFKGETIEELAKNMNIDPAVLKSTVEEFNAAVDSRVDKFGRQIFDKKLDKGPFYASQGEAMVHHTMGGVEINENAQVIDANGKIIEGLFAAGEVTGGIHGSNRLGGNAIADIITFGRIAGQNIMK